MHSEGILAGELKHGPLALIDKDMPVIMIIMKDACYTKCQNALQQVTARSVGPRTFTAKTERQDRETGERDRAERQDRETGQRDRRERQDRETGQRDRRERQERETGQRDRAERQDRETVTERETHPHTHVWIYTHTHGTHARTYIQTHKQIHT